MDVSLKDFTKLNFLHRDVRKIRLIRCEIFIFDICQILYIYIDNLLDRQKIVEQFIIFFGIEKCGEFIQNIRKH